MNGRKIHIKRGAGRTFCGIVWTRWRNGYRTWTTKNVDSKAPKEYYPLPTGTYLEAECLTCIKSFKILAETLSEESNLLSFFTLGQAHETRFMPKHYTDVKAANKRDEYNTPR